MSAAGGARVEHWLDRCLSKCLCAWWLTVVEIRFLALALDLGMLISGQLLLRHTRLTRSARKGWHGKKQLCSQLCRD
jgi:hypothetical protein